MKAMYINQPGEVEIREREMPIRKPGEALLKLLYGGICGSDLGSYKGTFAYFDYPRIPGHEFSAEIVEIDEDNKEGLKPGMIVTCNPYFNCGHCLLYPFLSLRSGTKRNENISLSLFFLYNSSCRELGILQITRR